MALLTWIVIGVAILAVIGLGVGTFFSGVIKGAELAANNPTVQNATGEAKEFVKEKIKSGIDGAITNNNQWDSDILVLTTSKATYNQGEPVTFNIKNNGNEALSFPNSAFGLEITNTDTGEEFPVFSAQVITSIEVEESKSITLPLEGGDGQPAGAGNYLAKVYTTPKGSDPMAEAKFVIT